MTSKLARLIVEIFGNYPRLFKFILRLAFPLKKIYPLQYLIFMELIDCKSILDLGCGDHSMIPILPRRIITMGVEKHWESYKKSFLSYRHKFMAKADVMDFYPDYKFEVIALLDVLEHLTKTDGNILLQRLESWDNQKIVIWTPDGFLEQDEYDGNPYMKHLSGWTAEEMRQRGYRVDKINRHIWCVKDL